MSTFSERLDDMEKQVARLASRVRQLEDSTCPTTNDPATRSQSESATTHVADAAPSETLSAASRRMMVGRVRTTKPMHTENPECQYLGCRPATPDEIAAHLGSAVSAAGSGGTESAGTTETTTKEPAGSAPTASTPTSDAPAAEPAVPEWGELANRIVRLVADRDGWRNSQANTQAAMEKVIARVKELEAQTPPAAKVERWRKAAADAPKIAYQLVGGLPMFCCDSDADGRLNGSHDYPDLASFNAAIASGELVPATGGGT